MENAKIKPYILVSFLREKGSEVENMLYTEFNMELALSVAREESMEDGIAIVSVA